MNIHTHTHTHKPGMCAIYVGSPKYPIDHRCEVRNELSWCGEFRKFVFIFCLFFKAFSSLYLSIKWIANCAQLQCKYELKSLLPKSLHDSGKSISVCVCVCVCEAASFHFGCICPGNISGKRCQRSAAKTNRHLALAACNVQLTACCMQHYSNNSSYNNNYEWEKGAQHAMPSLGLCYKS